MGGPVARDRDSLITAKTPCPSSRDDDDVRFRPGITADDDVVVVDAEEVVPSMTTVMGRISHLHGHCYFMMKGLNVAYDRGYHS